MSNRAVVLDVVAGARAKIGRARKHPAELEALGQAFSADKSYRIEKEEMGDEAICGVFDLPSVSEAVPLAAGDAIQNARAALDHIAVALVVRKTRWSLHGKKVGSVKFPIARNRDALAGAIPSSHMHRAGSNVVEEIKAIKPYKGGNNLLWAVRYLSNADKHRRLLTAAQRPTRVRQSVTWERFNRMIGDRRTVAIRVGESPAGFAGYTINPLIPGFVENGSIVGRNPVEYGCDEDYTFTIVIAERRVSGWPLAPFLGETIDEVERAVERLATCFVD